MKKTINSILAFTLVLSSLFLFSCSDNAITDNAQEQILPTQITQRVIVNTDVTNFLNSRYGKNNYTFGSDKEITDGNYTYIINEVVVRNESTARAYVGLDKPTNTFLYFAEVDRTNYKLEAVDIASKVTTNFSAINLEPTYSPTYQFNFVRSDSYETSGKRKFWGSSYSMDDCNPSTGLGTLYSDYYVLGIHVSHHPDMSTGAAVIGPCNQSFP